MAEIDLLRALEMAGYYEANEKEKEQILNIVINSDLEILARALEEYARTAQKEMSFLEWINRGGNNGKKE